MTDLELLQEEMSTYGAVTALPGDQAPLTSHDWYLIEFHQLADEPRLRAAVPAFVRIVVESARRLGFDLTRSSSRMMFLARSTSAKPRDDA